MANSLLPFERYLNIDPIERWWNWEVQDKLWNQNAYEISPEYLNSLAHLPLDRARYVSRAVSPSSKHYFLESHPEVDSNVGFKVVIDVSQFLPHEIEVKTFDNCVIIEGRHRERRDEHGYIARQFTRKYTLPYGYDISGVYSTLSADGILTVQATPPLPPRITSIQERIVPINQTRQKYLKF